MLIAASRPATKSGRSHQDIRRDEDRECAQLRIKPELMDPIVEAPRFSETGTPLLVDPPLFGKSNTDPRPDALRRSPSSSRSCFLLDIR